MALHPSLPVPGSLTVAYDGYFAWNIHCLKVPILI
jgi:hypothetical protein